MDNYENLLANFRNNRNENLASKMSQYMLNKFNFLGIYTDLRRKVSKPFIMEAKKNRTIDWIFLDKCFFGKYRELKYFVGDYLLALKDQLTFSDIKKIEEYIDFEPWWDTIDMLDGIVGNIGLKDYRVDNLMLKWSTDESIWKRRIAIDHQIGRKMDTNTQLLERIILNNIGTKEFFINKAIGWSLREYSKVNPTWVREFIDANKQNLSPLSIKEGSRYLK